MKEEELPGPWPGTVTGHRLLARAALPRGLGSQARSGGSSPRPPEMTSESFASRCLYLPGPAGTLPRRPQGQRVGPPHSTSSSCKRGALPGDLHRLRRDRHEWRPLEKLRSQAQGARRRPTGSPCEGAEPQPPDSLPVPRLCKGAGRFPSPFAGEGCQLVGCALGAPPPPPAHPTPPPPPPPAPPPPPPHTKKIGYILNKAIRFLIRGLGCSV
eukprot:XP_022266952.1 homeobox protein Hox-C4 isoform X2 [Canis lupus familiaris]